MPKSQFAGRWYGCNRQVKWPYSGNVDQHHPSIPPTHLRRVKSTTTTQTIRRNKSNSSRPNDALLEAAKGRQVRRFDGEFTEFE